MNHPNDPESLYNSELIRRISQGDETAFAELYDRFSPGLFSLALQIVSDHKEAEDVLQEAFYQIWSRAETYQAERSQAFTWAVMILRHKAIDRLRAQRRAQAKIDQAAELDPSRAVDHDSAALPEIKEERAAVRTALGRLPAEVQKAINLSFFSGLTHEEIARKLKEPLGTIKARIRRGLLQLRDALKETI